MAVLLVMGIAVCWQAESQGNPRLNALGVEMHDGNMEGKEVRFGTANSVLWAAATTAASNGSVNSMHDSFTPLGGLVPLLNIQLGEVIFGGVGSGLYGMLVYVVLTVFLAGLMIGRTPEYLGKKIEAYDVKVSVLLLMVPVTVILGCAAWACVSSWGLAGLSNMGPHGLTEMLYAFSSAVGNNGSAFAGLNANGYWYDTSLGVAMLLGRFFMIVPVLALAGNFAKKKSCSCRPRQLPCFRGIVYRATRVSGADCWGLDVLPCAFVGPDCRTFSYELLHFDLLTGGPVMATKTYSVFDRDILFQAVRESFRKLNPVTLSRNPVMFVTEVGAFLTTLGIVFLPDGGSFLFGLQITVWLWFTVLFANFAEAIAEGRGKAQANALRKTRTSTMANRLLQDGLVSQQISAEHLRKGDVVVVSAGETIPADGEVVEGVASVDESAITGESAPVIREAGGDRSSVTGGTRVLSDRIIVRVTADPERKFSRSHDRTHRRSAAAKNPQRDRSDHTVVRPYHHFSGGRDDTPIFRQIFGRFLFCYCSGCVACLPDPHHDWRIAERHRHRWNRPVGNEKCPCDEWSSRRSRRRR